jgi:hypothetical protein
MAVTRPALTIDVDEGPSVDVILPLPPGRESGVGVLDVDRIGIAVAGQPRGQAEARPGPPGLCISPRANWLILDGGVSRKSREEPHAPEL